MRNWFVDDVPSHLKRYSVWALGLLLAVEPTWAVVPEDLRAAAPEWLKTGVTVAIAAGGLVGALLKQPLAPSQFGLTDTNPTDERLP